MFCKSLPVCFLFLGAALCTPEHVQSDSHDPGEAPGLSHEDHGAMDKRSPHYNFGLGKRAYSYVSEYKRLPVYNFGLGYDQIKRARPYSFGLGKRFSEGETSEDKRARMYDFGLGKRMPLYNFGLGKRARSYSFGLGKRLGSKFNFGLGKRQRDLHRFSFGLGKRSGDDASVEESDNYFDV
ncbi:Statin [Operophtera brumata]|uniref:Statin n=1 Tax=Operophtera brumata TaxID=104452 RepID=A0A0L7KYJ7_OPEBR|nr:Statin [Operophtera brumata]